MHIYEAFCWLVTIAYFGFFVVVALHEWLCNSHRSPSSKRDRWLPKHWQPRPSDPVKDELRQVLLRPSIGPDTDVETLLRSALPYVPTEHKTLLRPLFGAKV